MAFMAFAWHKAHHESLAGNGDGGFSALYHLHAVDAMGQDLTRSWRGHEEAFNPRGGGDHGVKGPAPCLWVGRQDGDVGGEFERDILDIDKVAGFIGKGGGQ